MNTKNVLKFYLVATLTLTGLSVLSTTDLMQGYLNGYADVLGYKYNEPKDYITRYVPSGFTSDSTVNKENYYRDNPYNIVLTMTNNGSKSMVSAGTKNADFMSLSFRTLKEDVIVNNLYFKIEGADGGNIDNAYLTDGKNVVSRASISEEYIKFNDIGYEIKANGSGTLNLQLDLSQNLRIGSIIKLYIEQPKDIGIKINGSLYSINGHYPLRGKLLSIVKAYVTASK